MADGETSTSALGSETGAAKVRRDLAANLRGTVHSVASFASGCVSGVMSAVILQPTDVLKTKMQGDVLQTGQVRSVLAVTQSTIREGGVKSMWAGTKPAVVRVGLGIGVYMSVIEVLRKKFGEVREDGSVAISPMGALATGAGARTLATILEAPITVVKTRVEYFGAQPRKNFMQCVVKLAKNEGIGGMYRGVLPTIASSVPFSAIYYSLYTSFQSRLKENRRLEGKPPMLKNLMASSCAALVATVATQPADILRTQAQLNFTNANALRMLYSRCKELGFGTLFIGSAPRFAKRTLQAVLVWTVYEELFSGRLLGKLNLSR